MADAYLWQRQTIVSGDGEKIGTISEIYGDPQTGKPESVTVAGGLFGTRSNVVALTGAAPGVESDGEIR